MVRRPFLEFFISWIFLTATSCFEISDDSLSFKEENLLRDNELILASVTFDCKGKAKGYYADEKFNCAVFHYCDQLSKRYSYKCKDGKRFDQGTRSCIYFPENRCNPSKSSVKYLKIGSEDAIPVGSNDRTGKLSFIAKLDNSSDSLEPLSAFASLTQRIGVPDLKDKTELKTSASFHVENYLKKPSERSLFNSQRNVNDVTTLSKGSVAYIEYNVSPSPHSFSKKEIGYPNEDLSRKSTEPLRENGFIGSYHESNGQTAIDNLQKPFFYRTTIPPSHQPSNFPKIIKNVEALNEAESHNIGKTFDPVSSSHFHFSPPGVSLSVKHPNIQSNFRDSDVFQGSSDSRHLSHAIHHPPIGPKYTKKRKPPSIFASPTPSPFKTSTLSSPFYRTNLNPTHRTPEFYYNDYPSSPVSSLHYNNPTYYYNPASVPQKPPKLHNYPVYDNVPYAVNPYAGSPHLPPETRISNPSPGINNDIYYHPFNLPIRTPHSTGSVSDSNNFGQGSLNKFPVGIPKPVPVTVNPLNYVGSQEPVQYLPQVPKTFDSGHENLVSRQPNEELITNEELYKTRDEIHTEDYVETLNNQFHTPDTKKKEEIHKPLIVDVKNLNIQTKSKDEEEEEEEEEEAPTESLIPSRVLRRKLQRNRLLSQRRKTLQKDIRDSQPVIKQKAKTDVEKVKEEKSHQVESFEPKTKNQENISMTTKKPTVKATVKPTVKPIAKPTTKPTAKPVAKLTRKPIAALRGSLKERLNRLGTRRRILNRGKLRTKSNANVEKSETSLPDKNSLEKDSAESNLNSPKSKDVKPEGEIKELKHKTPSRLKSRLSNVLKVRTPGRGNRRPLARRLKSRKDSLQIDKSEKTESKNPDNNSELVKVPEDETQDKEKKENKREEEKSQIKDVSSPASNINDGNDTKRTRPMRPDIRARFKQFLKNRKTRLNERKPKIDTENAKEDEIQKLVPEKPTEGVTDQEEGTVNPKDVNDTEYDEKSEDEQGIEPVFTSQEAKLEAEIAADSNVDESIAMKKSIPLFREDKLVLINDNFEQGYEIREKRLSEGTNIPKISIFKNKDKAILGHPLAKPFRYMLNKRRTDDKIEDNIKLQNETKSINNEYALEHQAITKHKVVMPSNFKQIVNLHPRNPSEISSAPPSQNKSTKARKRLYKRPDDSEKEVYILDVSNKKRKSKSDNVSETWKESSPTAPYEEAVLEMDDGDFGSGDEEESDTSKPVFNLDSIVDIKLLDDIHPHISALDNNGYKTKLSSVKFEPFIMTEEKPLLPIERLLKLN